MQELQPTNQVIAVPEAPRPAKPAAYLRPLRLVATSMLSPATLVAFHLIELREVGFRILEATEGLGA